MPRPLQVLKKEREVKRIEARIIEKIVEKLEKREASHRLKVFNARG